MCENDVNNEKEDDEWYVLDADGNDWDEKESVILSKETFMLIYGNKNNKNEE